MIRNSNFMPAWWLPGPHLQTLWPVWARRHYQKHLRRERLATPDGDFLDLAWTTGREQGPLVIVLHGLEGSIDSHYAATTLNAVVRAGWRGVLMHFRGCSGEPNRAVRSYHSGETGDIDFLVRTLRAREPDTPLAVVGYSLGGNVLLKWLGERGADRPVSAAVAVSVPYELDACARRLQRGFSRLYQRHLVDSLRQGVREKFRHRDDAPFDLGGLAALRTFREFDDYVTAPLHGFAGVDDYYSKSSSRQYLKDIHAPALLLHAADDPFMTPDVVPREDELGPGVTLELSPHGGHVGFVGGAWPWRPRYWLEQRIPKFLRRYMQVGPDDSEA